MWYVRLISGCIAARWVLFMLGLVVCGGCWYVGSNLTFDRSIENMFAADDPLLAPFKKLRRTFGGSELVLAAYTDAELLTSAGLERLERLTADLAAVPGVAGAFSLTQNSPLGKLALASPLRQRLLELSRGYTISADLHTAGIICTLQPESASALPRAQTIERMRRLVERPPYNGVLTGEPVMVAEGFRYLDRDGRVLGATASLLLAAVLLACFRSLRWVLVPAVVVQAALFATRGTLVLAGLSLSMVSSMLWAIVTVVGVATVVHLIVRYRAWRGELEPAAALERAGADLAAPIFWSLATDAVGFGSLLAARVGPVQDFGTMMVMGSLFILPALLWLTPGVVLAGRFDRDPRRVWGESRLEAALAALACWVHRHPRRVAQVCLAVAAAGIAGAWRLDIETDFTRNFRAASPVARSYRFVEERLGGAGAWEIMVPVPQGDLSDFWARLERLQARLREAPLGGRVEDSHGQAAITQVLSPLDVMGLLPLTPPRTDAELEKRLALLSRQFPLVGFLYGRDPQAPERLYLRVMLRSHERQSAAAKRELIERVESVAAEQFAEAEVTGYFVLLAHLIESVVRDQWLTFAVASLGIGGMMLAAFRSWRLALTALVPNGLPVLLVMGILGWAQIPLNMGAAMIAAVSMGLSVDSSIHYLTAYRRAVAAGLNIEQALLDGHLRAGRAMFFSTLALVAGFGALSASEFIPTIYFGVLVSVAMLGGLAGNLIVLPCLLRLWSPPLQPAIITAGQANGSP
ncbi:MAG: MMPL family transporter [Pirellulales bacterium]|nr:MMPL family transporter [Pirellulales bacterium]